MSIILQMAYTEDQQRMVWFAADWGHMTLEDMFGECEDVAHDQRCKNCYHQERYGPYKCGGTVHGACLDITPDGDHIAFHYCSVCGPIHSDEHDED